MTQTCLILAGGLGTRLRSVVNDVPKCLAPIGGKPFIAFQIEALAAAGIDDVVLSLGYMADKVITALGSEVSGVSIRYIVEPQLLGTGGAISFAFDQLDAEELLVVNGDSYFYGNMRNMLHPLRRSEGEMFRVAVLRVPSRYRFGGIEITGDGRVSHFVSKGDDGPGLINAGIYRICREVFAKHDEITFSLESDTLPTMVREKSVFANLLDGEFIDIGIPEDYTEFCRRHGK